MTNQLHDHPKWYNAITHNCTTEIYTLKSMKGQPWDWRVLLNGKGDEMAYEKGLIVTGGLPFKELKQRAWINPAAQAADQCARFFRAHPGKPAGVLISMEKQTNPLAMSCSLPEGALVQRRLESRHYWRTGSPLPATPTV